VVLDGDLVPIQIKALLEEEQPTDEEQARALELARKELKRQERNEYEALEEAVPDHVLKRDCLLFRGLDIN
jgi:hypothetical protein